jgi:anti-anti-sigma factor
MRVRCECGYVGEVEAAEGEALCPSCEAPVRQSASFSSDAVTAERWESGLVVTVAAKTVKQIDTERLQQLVFEVLSDAKWAVVDLAGVEHMGSSAMSVLVRVATQRALGLVNVSPRVATTFRAMGLESFFTVYGTIAEAVEALKAGEGSE